MNKVTNAAADFQRKPYVKPHMKVVETIHSDIICTSGTSTQALEEEEFNWN